MFAGSVAAGMTPKIAHPQQSSVSTVLEPDILRLTMRHPGGTVLHLGMSKRKSRRLFPTSIQKTHESEPGDKMPGLEPTLFK